MIMAAVQGYEEKSDNKVVVQGHRSKGEVDKLFYFRADVIEYRWRLLLELRTLWRI